MASGAQNLMAQLDTSMDVDDGHYPMTVQKFFAMLDFEIFDTKCARNLG